MDSIIYELFKNVLILTASGSAAALIVLCLKYAAGKRISEKQIRAAWIAVLIVMIFPIYKFVPQKEIQKFSFASRAEITENINRFQVENMRKDTVRSDKSKQNEGVNIFKFAAYTWFFGACVFALVISTSYAAYVLNKRKRSVPMQSLKIFDDIKKELGIRRNIKVRISEKADSPMLVGVIFPVIYLPCREISESGMRLIFLHELTHYKHRDLFVKWFAAFVNMVHWFNPICYMVCRTLGETCEFACDAAVTENMSEEERKTYMNIIVSLAAGKEDEKC